MPVGKVQIDRGLFQIAMPEQDLDSAQVGAGFQKVGGKTVAEQMGIDALPIKASTFGSTLTRRPKHLRSNWAA
jgi:hypothetical protein